MLPGYHPLLQAADRVLLASSGGGAWHEGGQGAPEPPWPAALRTSFASLQASVHPSPYPTLTLPLTPNLTLPQTLALALT